jgi:2-desacetyl-2-hydroxyethyl bacteriochlorophyllide A dehydrogenase
MRALVFHGIRELRYEEVATPKWAATEVLVRVKAVGICGSDVHGYLGTTGRRIPPMIMGHEFAGVVEAIGADATGVGIGDRVAVFPYVTCGLCSSCREGRVNACPDKRMFGTFSTNGGMAQFVSVPATVLFPLPEDASFVHGALGEPLSVAARTVGKAAVAPGASVTIIGAGPIGLMCLILAKARGAKRIGVIDISEERLALARELGAAWVSNPQTKNSTDVLSIHLDERGADTVIEAVGIEATVSLAIQLVARGGKLVIVGMLEKRMPVDMHEIVSKEIRIEGSFLYGRQEFQGVLGQIESLRPQLDKIVSHTAPLSQGAEFFARLAAGEANACKVVLTD